MSRTCFSDWPSPHLDHEHFLGRAVELVERKRLHERADVARGECEDDVHVVGHARFAVQRAGGAAGDDVGNAEALQALEERREQARFEQAGRSFARGRGSAARSSRDGASARRPRAGVAPTSRAVRPATSASRASWRDSARSARATGDPRAQRTMRMTRMTETTRGVLGPLTARWRARRGARIARARTAPGLRARRRHRDGRA